MPDWVCRGYEEYAKRISGDCQLELVELPVQKRNKNSNIEQLKAREGKAILDSLKSSERLVVLDVKGREVTTEQLAGRLQEWQMDGRHVAIVIGGPDGIDTDVLQKADEKLSLSRLTLPHPMVRVLVAEQLYRAWSINHGHPYHR